MEEVFELAKESLASNSGASKEENISVEENVSEGEEEREVSASPPQLSNNNKSNKEVLDQFRALITDYLNGETIDPPDLLTQNVLSSYSLAGYLDHAVPSGKEIIITKLLQQCCFILQELLRYIQTTILTIFQ